jgi:hypothetical protein
MWAQPFFRRLNHTSSYVYSCPKLNCRLAISSLVFKQRPGQSGPGSSVRGCSRASPVNEPLQALVGAVPDGEMSSDQDNGSGRRSGGYPCALSRKTLGFISGPTRAGPVIGPAANQVPALPCSQPSTGLRLRHSSNAGPLTADPSVYHRPPSFTVVVASEIPTRDSDDRPQRSAVPCPLSEGPHRSTIGCFSLTLLQPTRFPFARHRRSPKTAPPWLPERRSS